MRPHLQFLTCILFATALAQNNGLTPAGPNAAPATIAIVDITVTQTIEIADFPTSATGLIYDTSPVQTKSATSIAMPTSVFITALTNTTRPSPATVLAGNSAANRTGTAKPSATTKSLGSTLDGRMMRLWEGLLAVAVTVVVLC